MPTVRHLQNSPISEALIDIRVVGRHGFQAEAFSELREVMTKEYPKIQEHRGVQTEFVVKEGKLLQPTQTELGLKGVFFRSQDGRNVAQFRVDGFTFNRLRPYTSWETILPEALRLWSLYWQTAKPQHVSRIGLRYINHLTLPVPTRDLSEYLAISHTIPLEPPLTMSSFLISFALEERQVGIAANVTLALEPSTSTGAPLIFDIDAYKLEDVDPQSEAIRERFEILRTLKNRIFFGSVTEKFIKAYE